MTAATLTPTTRDWTALARERLEAPPTQQCCLMPGSVVKSGPRLGKVIAVIRSKALVMWQTSHVAAWSQTRLLRLA